jgi:group I intron endonuclease
MNNQNITQKNNCGIYKVTNKITGKFYIGSSKDINKRWYDHRNELSKNKHCNMKLQNAWNYYGADAFEFTMIENTTEEDLLIRELFYLDMFKPYLRDIGYNIVNIAGGGDSFTHHPNKELLREKYSNMWSGEGNPFYGHKHSNQSIELQKQKAAGRYTLEWFKNKYGEDEGLIKYQERNEQLKNRKMNYSYDNGLAGTKRGKMSDENKKRISENKARLKLLKPQIFDDIKSEQYTIQVLADKYNTSTTMIKYYKKQIKSGKV